MSCIGLSCVILLSNGQLRVAVIRASSQPLYADSDLSSIRVLLEWTDADYQEWVHLTDSETFQAVFLEKTLLWARRVLPSEVQRAVAWPAKAFTMLCGSLNFPPDAVVIEYFCDKERTQLYLHETKELLLSEARSTLSQHPMMLHELNEWEEHQRSRDLLNNGRVNLTGHRVHFYNIQNSSSWISGIVSTHNLQTKELTVVEDHAQTVQTINPLMVHVLVQLAGDEALQQPGWVRPPSLTNSPDVSIGNGSPATPHLTSPIIQECPSPNLFNQTKSFYRTSSMDMALKRNSLNHSQRRSSLQHLNSPLTFEPSSSLHRRSSLDPLTLHKYQSSPLDHTPLDGHSQSMITLNRLHSPNRGRMSSSSLIDGHTPHGLSLHLGQQGSMSQLSNHGSTSQLSNHGSNTSLNEHTPLHSFPTFPSPDEFFNERSKSLSNIFTSTGQRPLQHASSYPAGDGGGGYLQGGLSGRKRGLGGLSRSVMKKPRFELLPTISADPLEGGSESPNKSATLSRSFSQPAIFAPKRSQPAKQKSLNRDKEDDLDIINQIIDSDETTLPPESAGQMNDTHGRSLSLSHINNFSSLPIIPSDESIHHVLKETYFSAPDFSRFESPPSYETTLGLKHEQSRPLSHESRSSSLGDFQAACDRVDEETSLSMSRAFNSRRSSLLSSHSLSNSAGDVSNEQGFTESPVCDSTYKVFPHNHRPCQHGTSSEGLGDLQREGTLRGESESPPKLPLGVGSKGRLEAILSLRMDRQTAHNGGYSANGCQDGTTPTGYMPSRASTSSDSSYSAQLSTVRPSWPGDTGTNVNIVGEAEILSPLASKEGDSLTTLEEFSIAKVINQHVTGDMEDPSSLFPSDLVLSPSGSSIASNGSGDKIKTKSKKNKKESMSSEKKNPRGRPRLTEEEKQRRKELRELGLMKRSKRRTKEEVEQWRAEKILTPVKRGRKPGSGKKNIVKAITGKPVFVNVDMKKYPNGTILLQNGFCRAFPGVSKCLDCGNCEGELPVSRYCRFLEFRKLCISDNSKPLVTVKGFADYTDVNAEDLVPWTPLKAGFSSMDESTALFLLRSITEHFIFIATEQARALPDMEGTLIPVWRRPVQGIRELCDMCATSLFNFHWVCPHCGFCICPVCYRSAQESREASSQLVASWPSCVATGATHVTGGLILAQIIPANVLAEVLVQALWLCEAQKVQVPTSSFLLKLVNSLAAQEPQSKFRNEPNKKSKTPNLHLKSPLQQWLCNGRLLCLLDPSHPDNLAAFQSVWGKGQAVVVAGVHNRLTRELWTPESFERDFGEELADFVDCRNGLLLQQLPSRVFWSGFSKINLRMVDPVSNDARLLKLKDWPTCDDFGEKLPSRYQDLMNALPLQEYTRREGKFNMASSLPSFFVKPDLGPKMYCAYGSVAHSNIGTTNLHLDISSAVNVMVYTSVPVSMENQTRKMISEIVASECCPETVQRISETGAEVGAIWHIYAASEADKLRTFLRKVNEERGIRASPSTDPIHDQLMYLDSDLRERLYCEHGVKGWSVAQCHGDAIFLPAGAPHQVRNLHDCVKIALDFVSPEQIGECLKLTEEFRQLSEKHVNREDKLQTQNIIYHSMKDVVGALKSYSK